MTLYWAYENPNLLFEYEHIRKAKYLVRYHTLMKTLPMLHGPSNIGHTVALMIRKYENPSLVFEYEHSRSNTYLVLYRTSSHM